MINVALVGCGSHSRLRILPGINLTKDLKAIWVADPNLEFASNAAAQLGTSLFFKDWRDGFSRQMPDAVIVVASPHVHFDIAQAALSAGVHVMTEKPMVIGERGASILDTLSQKASLTTLVGHNIRHAECSEFVKEAIDSDEFGKLQNLTMTYHASNPRGDRWGLESPRKSFLLSHFSHCIDYVSFLTGDSPLELLFADFDEASGTSAVAVLKDHYVGTLISILASNNSPHFDFRINAVGDRRSLILQNGLQDAVIYSSVATKRNGRFWTSKTINAGRDQSGYANEIQKFTDAILSGTPETCMPSFSLAANHHRLIDQIDQYCRRDDR